MRYYENEENYMNSEIKCTEKYQLYNIFWGDTEDESFSILCNASQEDLEKELSYFKKFRANSDVWEEFESFLIKRGYKAERYFVEEPTYINFNECNIN